MRFKCYNRSVGRVKVEEDNLRAVAMCTCGKKLKMKAKDLPNSKYHITEHKDDLCVYCGHYVHWRTGDKLLQSIEEFTRCDTRCEITKRDQADLTKDERYVYGYTICR